MGRRTAEGNGNGEAVAFLGSSWALNFVLLVLISWGTMIILPRLPKYNEGYVEPPDPSGYDRIVTEIEAATAAKIEAEIGRLREELIEAEIGRLREELIKRVERSSMMMKMTHFGMPAKCSTKEEVRDFAGKVVDEAIVKQNMRLDEAIQELHVKLDGVRAFTQEFVEEAVEKHSADGLARADFVIRIVNHSEAIEEFHSRYSKVHLKMVSPSTGNCFAFKGSSGFAHIELSRHIIPAAITLEHVSKDVALDKLRRTAPKDCKVFGWLYCPMVQPTNMLLLKEFTYDLERSAVQTFDVSEGYAIGGLGVINAIKFEFTSNHGNPDYTCVYRIRVHGCEPVVKASV